jgi:mono/diheme cytochrome c family protein
MAQLRKFKEFCMKSKIVFLGLVGLSTALFASNEAQSLFDSKCAMCHIKTMPQDRSKLVAPAIMGVMRHVKMQYPKKEDAVAFIVDYVQNPSEAKAVCMPQKIKHFGLMPSQKENITAAELQDVASWMYDNYPPANFKGRGMMMQKQ